MAPPPNYCVNTPVMFLQDFIFSKNGCMSFNDYYLVFYALFLLTVYIKMSPPITHIDKTQQTSFRATLRTYESFLYYIPELTLYWV